MTYLAKRYIIEEVHGWYLNRMGQPTRFMMDAEKWLTPEEAETTREKYARLNPKVAFRVLCIESLRPDGEWENVA